MNIKEGAMVITVPEDWDYEKLSGCCHEDIYFFLKYPHRTKRLPELYTFLKGAYPEATLLVSPL